MSSIANVFIITQKEFADHIRSPKTRLLISALILILLSESVLMGQSDLYLFKEGGGTVVQIFGLFFPILGLALGFDSIVKERNSNSLNTLLTHPVFRDNIIAGKITGGMATLCIVIAVSLGVSQGAVLVHSGIRIEMIELNRLLIFAVVSFIYLSTFFGLGLILSILSRDPAGSFLYGVVIWIVFVLTFGAAAVTIASVASGGSVMFGDDVADQNADALYESIQCLSPTNHYSMVVSGINGMSQGNIIRSAERDSSGVFDTGHSLNEWINDYWTNIVVLIATPVLLFIASFIIFIKKDITR